MNIICYFIFISPSFVPIFTFVSRDNINDFNFSEYDYIVDSTKSAILLLNYAVVLQDPEHNEIWQPKFELEVLKNGKPISNKGCGEAKFTAGANTSEKDGWHKFGTGWWKDWTTISINLREHHGEEVVVRLTTYDCAELGHFGYAYFTLDCADAAIKSTSCGETINMEMLAPDGFRYIWTRRENRDSVISTEQSI